MSNVEQLDVVTLVDIEPDQVLNGAMGKLDHVIIIGVEDNGEKYFASSSGDQAENLWLIEKFKQFLLDESE